MMKKLYSLLRFPVYWPHQRSLTAISLSRLHGQQTAKQVKIRPTCVVPSNGNHKVLKHYPDILKDIIRRTANLPVVVLSAFCRSMFPVITGIR